MSGLSRVGLGNFAKLRAAIWLAAVKDFLKEPKNSNVIVVEELLTEHWNHPAQLMFDLIHPNQHGYEIFKDQFKPALAAAIMRHCKENAVGSCRLQN